MSPELRDIVAGWMVATALVVAMTLVVSVSDRLPPRPVAPGAIGFAPQAPLVAPLSLGDIDMHAPLDDRASFGWADARSPTAGDAP